MSADFVFLHGGGQGSWIWRETVEALRLQGGRTVGQTLALDVPGCGAKRDWATDGLEVSDIVESLLADIDAARLKSPLLVGHSQAGTILPLIIRARPALFSHAVYVSCLAPAGADTALSWRSGLPGQDGAVLSSGPAPGTPERYRLMFCNDMAPAAADAFLAGLGKDRWPASSYAMSGWDYRHLAEAPSTYVLCLRDAALLPAWQEIFAARLMAKAVVAIDAGHQVMNTRPHALAEVLLGVAARAVPDSAER